MSTANGVIMKRLNKDGVGQNYSLKKQNRMERLSHKSVKIKESTEGYESEMKPKML